MIREYLIALRNVVLGTNLSAVPLVAKPRDMVFYAGECLFLRRAMRTDELPQKAPWDGCVENLSFALCPTAAHEWVKPLSASYAVDLVALCAFSALLKPKVIFEIGTLHGSSALHLAANSPESRVFSLDLPHDSTPSLSTTVVDIQHVREHKRHNLFFKGHPEEERITLLYGDSATFDFSSFHRQVDLFFIDGAHSYEYVRNDTLKALECCHPGSVIAWHDYGRCGVNGVTKWLHEFRHTVPHPIYRVPGGSLAYMPITP